MVTRARGRNRESRLNGYIVSVWDDEIVLERDSSGGYTTLSMYLMHTYKGRRP